MARLNKTQRDTLLHQASLIDQVASQLEGMPCRAGTRWPYATGLQWPSRWMPKEVRSRPYVSD